MYTLVYLYAYMFVSVWLFTVRTKVLMVLMLVGGAFYLVLCMSVYICIYVLGSVP